MLCDLISDGDGFLKALNGFTIEAIKKLGNKSLEHVDIYIKTELKEQLLITSSNKGYSSSCESSVVEPGIRLFP